MFKTLVGVASVCVIAVSAHYAYGVYRDSELAKAEAMRNVQAISEARDAESFAALEAECTKRVPSQSTDNLKGLYKQCLADNAAVYGVEPPAE